MSELAICPGSFDPVTNGHLDIIRRAADIFGQVVVLVVINPDKTPTFTAEERVALLRRVTQELPNVRVESYCGLLTEYLKQRQARVIIKGLRAVSDYEYECQMAMTNHRLLPSCETFFLTASAENMYLSSSLVKQVARFGGDISPFVPQPLLGDIAGRLARLQERNDQNS